MKRTLLAILVLLGAVSVRAQWKPAGDNIKTQWAADVNPAAPLPEYPRPIMQRESWQNLNGLWNYAIWDKGETGVSINDGKILVPFAVESSLSGVQKFVGKDKELWYERTFTIPASWSGKDISLNFGAVDYKANVWLNGIMIGTHEGGFGHFSFDITPYLRQGEQKLVVRVWDPTTDGHQAVGKQRTRSEGIWYTPVTGIWQTVWLEPVSHKHFTAIVSDPDIDHNSLKVKTSIVNAVPGDIVKITVKDGGNIIAQGETAAGQEMDLSVKNAKLWSPEQPFLYDVTAEIVSGGTTVDKVESYAAMRKVSMVKDKSGIWRMALNNKPYFQYGPLDQGYWPDGLYTAPTDDALKFDIQKTKDYGFNMIRKHMKVEPDRWYTWCDRLGIVVWQDMPSSDFENQPSWQNHQYYNSAEGKRENRSDESKDNFYREWKEIIIQHREYPSIVVWTPFNEAWGQFDTEKVVKFTRSLDNTRLINAASGGNHTHAGDILDLHNYPGPMMYMFDFNRLTVLGEYGGLGLPVKGHVWTDNGNWGYAQFKNFKEVTDRYVDLAEELKPMVRQGFSAAVYTQTTDVEIEVNGLMTYDRKVFKIDEKRARNVNQSVIKLVK